MRKSARPGRALPGAPRRYTEAEAAAITANTPKAVKAGGDRTMKPTTKQLAAARAADAREKADQAARKAEAARLASMTIEQRYDRIKSRWATRKAEVEAALARIHGDPEFKAEMEQAWANDEARIEASISRLDRSVGVAVGKAVEPVTDKAAETRLRNIGMTPIAAKATTPKAAPTAAEREAARRRVQANLGVLPRS